MRTEHKLVGRLLSKNASRVALTLIFGLAGSQLGAEVPPKLQTQVTTVDGEVISFIRARNEAPFWLADRAAVNALLALMSTSDIDGRPPMGAAIASIRSAMQAARTGKPAAQKNAEVAISKAFVAYATAVARPPEAGKMLYVDDAARPRPVSPSLLLKRASQSPSLEAFVTGMAWMHPYYRPLRAALQTEIRGSNRAEKVRLLRLNLNRARVLPRGPARSIVVNTAAARLEFFEVGKVRDTMRVVVGQKGSQTPMMAGLIRYAILNPYWHVPTDLARERIAPRVLKEGQAYLKSKGYEIVTEWSRNAKVVSPSSVDWKAVAAGKKEVLIRQLPGPSNGMGQVKFMFPNDLGIYLHDTPGKALFKQEERQFSAGCVRLEDAKGLQKIILGDTVLNSSTEPEQAFYLKAPVPVFLTYMTVYPQDGRIVQKPDIYGRDRAAAGNASAS